MNSFPYTKAMERARTARRIKACWSAFWTPNRMLNLFLTVWFLTLVGWALHTGGY